MNDNPEFSLQIFFDQPHITSDIDADWDGTYNGKPQPFDMFVYEVEAVTKTGRVFHKHGNVTLV